MNYECMQLSFGGQDVQTRIPTVPIGTHTVQVRAFLAGRSRPGCAIRVEVKPRPRFGRSEWLRRFVRSPVDA